MAHPPIVKAEALSRLILFESVSEVAKEMGLPKQTVSRWKPEADQFWREIVRSSPELQAIGKMIHELLPGLGRPNKNGTKKRTRAHAYR